MSMADRFKRKYYDSLPGMLHLYKKLGHVDHFTGYSVEELREWQENERKVLRNIIGLDRLYSALDDEASGYSYSPDRWKEMEIVSPEKGIIRKKVIFEVDKYTFMPMYVLEPEGNFSRLYYAFAGHQGGGKESVAGVREIKEISEKIDFFNYDYGLKLARKGFTVICPDPRGFGERRDASAQGDNAAVLSCSCRNISNMAIPLGLSVIGLLAYDYMRLTDYLEASGKYDISELSCIGFSGGGMQTLFLSAVDRRIKRALISGYMYGVKDALLLLNNNCNCNYVPGLWEHFDMGDIGALLAPIPLVIQSCRDDHLNGERGLENVYEQLEIIKKAYKLMKAEKMLIHDIRPGGHHFHDEILTADLLSDKG